MKHIVIVFLALLCLRTSLAGLPPNMTITADGNYDFTTVPGSRWILGLSGDFETGTVQLHYRASDGQFQTLKSGVSSSRVWDFRAPGNEMRLYVVGISEAAGIVITLANVPGATRDDEPRSFTTSEDWSATSSGTVAITSGSSMALATGANGNITLSPHGTGITTTAGRLTVTNATASSSTSTGAAVFTGGVGIGGNLHINGNITALNSSTTYGNLTVGPTGFAICSGRGGFKATAANEVEIIGSGYSTPASLTAYNGWRGFEMTAPAAPAANGYHIFAEDNGSGKTRLMVRFPTGAAQQIAIEP